MSLDAALTLAAVGLAAGWLGRRVRRAFLSRRRGGCGGGCGCGSAARLPDRR